MLSTFCKNIVLFNVNIYFRKHIAIAIEIKVEGYGGIKSKKLCS